MPAPLLAWLLLGVLFFSLKAVVLARAGSVACRQLGIPRLLGFLLLWPGMSLQPFLDSTSADPGTEPLNKPAARQSFHSVRPLVVWGLLNILMGAALLGIAVHWGALAGFTYVRAAVGILGVGLLVLFGAFHWLTAFWRWRGVPVQKQWDFLPASQSLAEYWSVRWNRAFHDFARHHVFVPLRKRFGRGAALIASFFFSGLVHELLMSVPARGGYGGPLLFFILQGAGIWCERRWRLEGWTRRAWAALVLLGPMGLLFHRPFMENVVLPQLHALGGQSG